MTDKAAAIQGAWRWPLMLKAQRMCVGDTDFDTPETHHTTLGGFIG